ncbi:MAG: HAMP domain-containing sensor histidine kinase [Nitrospiraceae bacterium]
MKKWLGWNERTRLLLTSGLAVVLPAAALIGFSIWNLQSIQRDKVIEAAIQRDFQHMLQISEKRIAQVAYKKVGAVRRRFPCPEDPFAPELDKLLEKHPYVAHAFLVYERTGLVFRSQPRRMKEAYFRKESKELSKKIGWVKSEGKMLLKGLRQREKNGDEPYYFYSNWVPRGKREGYQAIVLFPLPEFPQDRFALGGIAFDSEYLKEEFFPAALDNLLSEELADGKGGKNKYSAAVMMVRPRESKYPLATSAEWDGGYPEVQRNLEAVFNGLTLGIKFRGTTVEAIAQQFLRNSLLIIGGLSLFLAGGIFLTYRNVTREMALAKLKSDFVSNVSHELRTPLALIRLYAETLEMGRLRSPEKHQEYFSIIRKESERLTALINNILDFSRIEAGKKEYKFDETNLAELVRNTLESYRYQIEQLGFEFELNISDDLPPLQVDREAMARSLLNLVNNAVKYSQGDKFLGVNLYRANGSIKLEVIDHGIGIPRSEQAKVFEKFYRVGDSLVHNTKGSGVGLSLVRHIVQAHGGQVSVESTPGHGSKFTIALPLNPEANAARAAHT